MFCDEHCMVLVYFLKCIFGKYFWGILEKWQALVGIGGNKRPTFVLCPLFTQLRLNIAPKAANLYFTQIHISLNFNAMLNALNFCTLFKFSLGFTENYMTIECVTRNISIIFVAILHFDRSKKFCEFLVVLCLQPILSLLFLKFGASVKIWALAPSFAESNQLTRGISHLHRCLKCLNCLNWTFDTVSEGANDIWKFG